GVVGLYLPAWLHSQGARDSQLALTEVIAGILIAVLAPLVGARTDHLARRIPSLRITTIVALGATAFLASGGVQQTLVLLGVALVGFHLGASIYDALLPTVSTPANRGRISGLGVAVGYLGSFVGLGLGLLTTEVLGLDDSATFRALAAGFLLFALPSFFLIKESGTPEEGRGPRLRDAFPRLVASWRRASQVPGVLPFLGGRFLYSDAINTLIGGFLTIFALSELDLTESEVNVLLALAITGAILGGLVAGRLVHRLGSLPTLRFALVGWAIAIGVGVIAATIDASWLAWAVGPLGGLALGATWTSDRVLMVQLSPPERIGEFYGLYATVGRFATILGPLTWALIVDGLGWGRPAAMLGLMAFILAGLAMLRRLRTQVPGLETARR
ncbi:MAG TPA: MFS transporter, partial [Acidimicrobiia bacterium]